MQAFVYAYNLPIKVIVVLVPCQVILALVLCFHHIEIYTDGFVINIIV